jgi:hypothetical protein
MGEGAMPSYEAPGGAEYFEVRKYGKMLDFNPVWSLFGSFLAGMAEAAREGPLPGGPVITPFRVCAVCVVLGTGVIVYFVHRALLRVRLVVDDEGIWENGISSPMRCVVRWEDVLEVRAGWHLYKPTDMVIRHTGRPRGWRYDFWWSAFDRSIPVLRMLREKVPAECAFGKDLESLLREAGALRIESADGLHCSAKGRHCE